MTAARLARETWKRIPASRTAVMPPPVLPDPGHTLNGNGPHE